MNGLVIASLIQGNINKPQSPLNVTIIDVGEIIVSQTIYQTTKIHFRQCGGAGTDGCAERSCRP